MGGWGLGGLNTQRESVFDSRHHKQPLQHESGMEIQYEFDLSQIFDLEHGLRASSHSRGA